MFSPTQRFEPDDSSTILTRIDELTVNASTPPLLDHCLEELAARETRQSRDGAQ
jgi:hypothetical protein